jgi:plasmid stabilization system protein ParE
VKVSYRHAASDDVVRQFRYYLVTLNLPGVAVRFLDSVRRTVEGLRQHPLVGAQSAIPESALLAGCRIRSHPNLLSLGR